MTETYTFRYLNADGRIQAMIFKQFNDRLSAEVSAELLMPKTAAAVEIWCEDELISRESKLRSDTSEHTLGCHD